MIKLYEEFIDKIRKFFKERGYTEVFSNILQSFPNLDSNIYPISLKATYCSEEKTFYLPTSPEYSMKKVLSDNFIDIFEITKAFRDKECGSLNTLEFMILEFYKTEKDYLYLIEEIELLMKSIFGKSIKNISTDKEIISFEEAFEKYADLVISDDEDILKNNLISTGIEFDEKEDWQTLIERVFVEKVQRNLGKERITFLIDFPLKSSFFAKEKNSFLAQRFELFIDGIEIANGWTEDTNINNIKSFLEKESKTKNLPVDKELIKAYEKLQNKLFSGCAIGLDRVYNFYKAL